jgi:hypothetical protein
MAKGTTERRKVKKEDYKCIGRWDTEVYKRMKEYTPEPTRQTAGVHVIGSKQCLLYPYTNLCYNTQKTIPSAQSESCLQFNAFS